MCMSVVLYHPKIPNLMMCGLAGHYHTEGTSAQSSGGRNFMFCGSSERVPLPPEHPSLQTHRDQSSFRRTFGVVAEGGDMCPE